MGSQERRRQILEAAVEVFARLGYHKAGVSDIVEAAGVARGTFYLYFKSKRNILDEILDEVFGSILSRMHPIEVSDPPEHESVMGQLRDNLIGVLEILFEETAITTILVSEAVGLDREANLRLKRFYGSLADWIAESVEEGIEMGIIRPCDSRVAALALLGMMRGILWGCCVGGEQLDPARVVAELMELARSGMLV